MERNENEIGSHLEEKRAVRGREKTFDLRRRCALDDTTWNRRGSWVWYVREYKKETKKKKKYKGKREGKDLERTGLLERNYIVRIPRLWNALT